MEKYNNKEDIDKDYIQLIIDNLNCAIDNDYDYVHIGYFFEEKDIKFYNVAKKDWNKIIEIVIKAAIDLEEYEICSELKKIKEKINE